MQSRESAQGHAGVVGVELAHVRSPNRQEAACILDEATRSVNGGLLATWMFGIVAGSFTGVVDGCRLQLPWRCLEQQRRWCAGSRRSAAPLARGARNLAHARAPRPWPRARARCARAWRSESHRIAEVFDDDFQSLSACAHSPHCHVTLYYAFQTHRRPVPSLSHVTPLNNQLRDSAARGRATEATLEFLLHGMLLRHAAQPPRLGVASAAPVLRGLRMHQMRPGGTSRAVHAMTQLDTIGRERAQNDGVVLVRREDDLHPCQAPQSAKEERL